MGKFSETRDKLREEASSKKTFSEGLFNELGTALLNDPEYEVTSVAVKKGELVEEKTRPVEVLRKQVIGSVAKAAGSDTAEQDKLVAEHQFPRLDLYGYVDATMQEYLGLGKKFQFTRKEDFQGSIEMSKQDACIKDVKRPGSTEVSKQRQGAYTKLKAKSTCPSNLKKTL